MKQFKQNAWLWVMGMLLTLASTGQPNLSRVEYYIDNDPGFGNGTALSITSSTDLNALSYTIDFSMLNVGVHIVGIRSRDAAGAWSHDNKWLFAKFGVYGSDGPVPNIARSEYYIDTDPGYGNGTSITITPGPGDGTGTFTLDITSMSSGAHLLGIRTRDANGGWSMDNKWLFAKFGVTGADGPVPNIAGSEYYIDTDPGYGNGIPITITPGPTDGSGSFSLDISNMGTGVHVVGIRTRDANGGWSLDNKWLFANPVMQGMEGIVPNLARLEYYIDNDPGTGMGINVPIATGTDLPGISFSADITGLSTGQHKIFFRSQDSTGKWSHDNMRIFIVSAPAIVTNNTAPAINFAGDNSRLPAAFNELGWVLISPNPAREAVNVQVKIAHAGSYNLELIDMAGRRLIQKQFEWNAGKQSFRLPLDNIAHGPYLMMLSNEKERIYKKLIKAK